MILLKSGRRFVSGSVDSRRNTTLSGSIGYCVSKRWMRDKRRERTITVRSRCLQVSILFCDILDARTILDLWSSLLTLGKIQTSLVLLSLNRSLMGVQVVMSDDDGAGVTLVQLFK